MAVTTTPARPAPRIFLSSTHTDLVNEREIAALALQVAGMEVVRSEDFTAPGTLPPWPVCKRELETCHGYLLLLGDKYGSRLERSRFSYTRSEYEVARYRRLPVFVLQKKGLVPSGPDANLYRNFIALVRSALLSKEYDGPAELRRAVEQQFTNWRPIERADRPQFRRDPAPVSEDPLQHAIARIRRRVLREHRFWAIFVDTFTARDEAIPLDDLPRRLSLSLATARDMVREASVDGRLFQELMVAAGTAEERFRRRVTEATRRGSVIVCVVEGADDYPVVRSFQPRIGKLIAFRPAAVDEDDKTGADEQEVWVDADLDGRLAAAIDTYVTSCLDNHLVEWC